MRVIGLFLLVLVFAGAAAPPPLRAACADDYLTIETVRGIIIEIKPAPEPFKTSDIYFSGPPPCDRMWMQVLKTDASRCRVGRPMEATGVVTRDVENASWEIGPVESTYMTLGSDFHCS